jgi:hypothetical protein
MKKGSCPRAAPILRDGAGFVTGEEAGMSTICPSAVLTSLLAATVCSAQTWDNGYEGDNYDPVNNRCATGIAGDYFEVQLAEPPYWTPFVSTDGTTDYLVIAAGEDGRFRLRHTKDCCPQLLNKWLGWTVETRLRIVRYLLNPYAHGLFRLVADDDGASAGMVIGNQTGPALVGCWPDTAGTGTWSWEYGSAANQVLIEPLDDWHVYRVVCNPSAPVEQRLEVYVDGRLVAMGPVDDSDEESGRFIEFGSMAEQTGIEAHIDYIRWAGMAQIRPTEDQLTSPRLTNATFDNIYDPNGYNYPPAPIDGVPGWSIELLDGDLPSISEEMFTFRCEDVGKSLRLDGGDYDLVLTQRASVTPNQAWRFKVALNGLFPGASLEGRVGIGPDAAAGNPQYDGIVWSAWTSLVDGNGDPYPSCQDHRVVARASSDGIWVFINIRGGGNTFVDHASLSLAAPGDFDGDDDADLSDYSFFLSCYNGPNRPPAHSWCGLANADADGDVDLSDYGEFLSCYNGPNNPPACI